MCRVQVAECVCVCCVGRALALNCNAAVNEKNGAEAKDWKAGKPVRVVRSSKGRKHSKFSPEDGNRYDGIYKVRSDISRAKICLSDSVD